MKKSSQNIEEKAVEASEKICEFFFYRDRNNTAVVKYFPIGCWLRFIYKVEWRASATDKSSSEPLYARLNINIEYLDWIVAILTAVWLVDLDYVYLCVLTLAMLGLVDLDYIYLWVLTLAMLWLVDLDYVYLCVVSGGVWNFKLNDLTVIVKQGDITKESTDIIVNSTNAQLDLRHGKSYLPY